MKMNFKEYLQNLENPQVIVEAQDEETVLQALASKDINAKIDGKVVIVDKDDVGAAKKVLKEIGCSRSVKSGLNESVQGDFQIKIRKADKGECGDIMKEIEAAFKDKKINEKEFDMLTAMCGRKMDKLGEAAASKDGVFQYLEEIEEMVGKKLNPEMGMIIKPKVLDREDIQDLKDNGYNVISVSQAVVIF